jgi:hypothetical protein
MPDRDPGDRTGTGTRNGPGIVLITLYGIFALAAGARSTVQIVTRFDEAPVAYALSAVAAGVYILATLGLAGDSPGFRRLALVACTIELAGVLAIGTYSRLDPEAFPDETVWSGYGSGYHFIPLVLPVIGLYWLRRTARHGS